VVNATTGAIAQRLDYDSFGRVTLDTSPGFQPFGFAGGLYDPQTKLTRFGARDYDAQAGRWTNQDPLWFGGNDANLYRYCRNDPVNFLDPSGTDNWDAAQGFLDQIVEEISLTASPMLSLQLLIDSVIKSGARQLDIDPGPTMREMMFHSSGTLADRHSEDYATGEMAGVCVGVVGQLATGIGTEVRLAARAAEEAETLARQARIAERLSAAEGRKINFNELKEAAANVRNGGRRYEVKKMILEFIGWKTGGGGPGIGAGGGW
jgi:RHS repeat-associated protein